MFAGGDSPQMNEENIGIPEHLRVKRSYTMSPEALEARRRNAQLSTGPKTDEGKKASSKNAWKHGLYASSFILGKLGKPCKTTCPQYPCDLVNDGGVSPGESCLDKQFVAEAFEAIIKSAELKSHEDFNHLAALEMAGAIDILRKMKEAIIEDGVVIKSEKVDKDGNSLGFNYLPHPALAIYQKMLVDLGFTPQEFLMTPKEISKAEKGANEEDVATAASLMARAVKNLAKKSEGE